MAEMSLALEIINAKTDFSQIFIGYSCFTDDMWDMRPFIPAKTTKNSLKELKFGYIQSSDMKQTVKLFAYHHLGHIKPQSVRDKINSKLPAFVKFCEMNGISSFNQVTKDVFLRFNLWLRDTKKVAAATGYKCANVVEEIIRIGQIKGWNVPKINIFNGFTSNDLWYLNIKNKTQSNRTKPVPQNVLNQILYHAVHDENDVLTKTGMIIQSQTGLRISEVLSICEGCIQTEIISDKQYVYMEVTLSKTEKGDPVTHKVFINNLTKDAINELVTYTKPLRQKSGLRELFLIPYRGIRVLTTQNWDERLRHFIERWDIRDSKGNLYSLHSHQFRATYVRELIKKKIPIADIMEQYSHVSIEMTAHYLTLQEREVKAIYADMILSPESRISGIRAKEIKDTLDAFYHGRTEEEIDAVIDDLAKTMSFNPLPTGVCLYDFRRGNCTDGNGCFMYNCPNYLTEVRFYPLLKAELDLIEKEMARLKALGQVPAWQVQYVKWKYLKPLVEDLKTKAEGDTYVG